VWQSALAIRRGSQGLGCRGGSPRPAYRLTRGVVSAGWSCRVAVREPLCSRRRRPLSEGVGGDTRLAFIVRRRDNEPPHEPGRLVALRPVDLCTARA